jgi:hypothetical protein
MGKILVATLPFSSLSSCCVLHGSPFRFSFPSLLFFLAFSSLFQLLYYLRVTYNLLMFYQLVKYLAENNQILILRASTVFKKDQKIFSYWALIPPYLTILSMVSVFNYSVGMVRLMDRDEMVTLPSTMPSSSSVSAIQQFSEQNQMIEEEMKNYLSTSFPSSFGKPSDYNPNLYSKGLSRNSMLVRTFCVHLVSCLCLLVFALRFLIWLLFFFFSR